MAAKPASSIYPLPPMTPDHSNIKEKQCGGAVWLHVCVPEASSIT
jgi:hypothetical protein